LICFLCAFIWFNGLYAKNNIRWNTTSYLSKPCKTKQIIIIFECSVIHDFVFYDLGDYLTTRNSCEGEMCAIPCEERSPSCVGYPNGNNTFPGRQLTPFYMTCLLERTLSRAFKYNNDLFCFARFWQIGSSIPTYVVFFPFSTHNFAVVRQ
jgi:hypothetical protein